jgi:hypothetical protein
VKRRKQRQPKLGIYEKPRGSGGYWIVYEKNGQICREEGGTKMVATILFEAFMEAEKVRNEETRAALELLDNFGDPTGSTGYVPRNREEALRMQGKICSIKPEENTSLRLRDNP